MTTAEATTINRTIARLSIALLFCGVTFANLARAQETPAIDFVVAQADKQCDDVNRAWSVTNKHTYLSIQVTIQWHPAGGMQKEETMVLQPLQRRPVGCAPAVQIVSAQLMQF
jgi:hypothetical protein